MSSALISYFGYGSLVNRETRPKDEQAYNVTLNGWQRVWNHRVTNANTNTNTKTDTRHACTSLSIEPAQGVIQGVLVQIPEHELDALDQRESGYERMCLDASEFVLPKALHVQQVYVYRSLQHNRFLADAEHPVTQSYVDCVMAGYLKRFGDEGLQQLLQSTRGWNRPMLDDRHAPTYPRHVKLPAEQHRYFDSLLAPLCSP